MQCSFCARKYLRVLQIYQTFTKRVRIVSRVVSDHYSIRLFILRGISFDFRWKRRIIPIFRSSKWQKRIDVKNVLQICVAQNVNFSVFNSVSIDCILLVVHRKTGLEIFCLSHSIDVSKMKRSSLLKFYNRPIHSFHCIFLKLVYHGTRNLLLVTSLRHFSPVSPAIQTWFETGCSFS